jgi:uncharacterized protein YciU (UPF0263 family)
MMPTPSSASEPDNLSSLAYTRRSRRINQRQRAHKHLYDAADHIRVGVDVEIDASHFAKLWIGVGLQIAADVIEEMANELLVEDIVREQS